ncbi:hypothetical protein [Prosthecobacter sp.]|uniref:hypothetical protein n=1 Tax=Prosthecobacter sp. TaxID=1965333 RepID=UPI0037840D52
MTCILLLFAVIALSAFIHFLRRFSIAGPMRGWSRTQGRMIAVGQGPAMAALTCALLLVLLAAGFSLA